MNRKDRHNLMRASVVLRKMASIAPLNPADTHRVSVASRASVEVGMALAGALESMRYGEGQDAIEHGLLLAEDWVAKLMEESKQTQRR